MPARCSTRSTTCSAGRRSRRWAGCADRRRAALPPRVKDGPEVDFSTGSVGLGVAMTTFSALMADYVRLHGLGRDGPAAGPPHRHRRRRRTGRGQYLRGAAGGLEARRPRCLVDHRLQPPEPRLAWCPTGCSAASRACSATWAGTSSPSNTAASWRPRSRAKAARRLRTLDRRLPEQPVFRADVPGRRGMAAGGAGRSRPLEGRARHHRSAVGRRARPR